MLTLDASGRARLDPVRTTQLQIRVLGSGRAVSRLGDGSTERLGVGVSEVLVDGLPLLPVRLPVVPVDVGCGFGPPLRIGDQLFATTVTALPRQLFDGDPVGARICGPATVDVPSADTRVVITSAPAFRPVRVVMTQPREKPAATPSTDSAATVQHTSPVDRERLRARRGRATGRGPREPEPRLGGQARRWDDRPRCDRGRLATGLVGPRWR